MKIDPGARLGPYEILGLLGQGGMGEVYRARDARLSRDVAIKILPAEYSENQDRLRRFEHEARSVAMLNHPNILSIFDFGTENGSPYLVSELLEGRTLRQILSESKLTQRKAIDYGLQIANGLAAAHEKGIIHRDLKPENLYVTHDGRVKILDFGLAKLKQPDVPTNQITSASTLKRETAEGVILGTVGYMSPEQVRGSVVDQRSDLFTFGAILFEMLTGKRAFHGESNVECLNAILTEDPFESSESGISLNPTLQTIIRHCLEKNPAERFQSARDLAFHVQTISTGGTTTSMAIPESKRTKWLRLPLILAIALPVALGIGFLTGRISSTAPEAKVKMVSGPSFQRLTYRRGYMAAARFASDGNSVIYSASWDGGPVQLFTTRPENPQSGSFSLPPAGIFAVSSTGEMAISVNCKISGYSGSCAGTLARVPIAGGAPKEILENVIAADWSPNGKELMAAVNSDEGGHIEYPVGKTIFKTSGIILHARLSPQGDRIAFFESQGSELSLVIIRLDGQKQVLSTGWATGTGLCWKSSNEIWFTGAKKGVNAGILAVDSQGHERTITSTPGGIKLNDISEDGRVLLTSQFGRYQLLALPPNSSREVDLSWLSNSVPADLSNDGQTLLITEQANVLFGLYVRKTDGSPAVLLGPGMGLALSPDKKWVVSRSGSVRELVLYPTGPGQPKHIALNAVRGEDFGRWFPDSNRILFNFAPAGHKMRAYSIDIRSGTPEPLTQEGSEGFLVSPDGNFVLAADKDFRFSLVPIAKRPAQSVKGLEPDDIPIQWCNEVHSVFVVKDRTIFEYIERVDLVTGRRELVKDIRPLDPAGVVFSVGYPKITPDGKVYVYGFNRILGDLFLAKGLQ
jgi:serine/threonine protein kinase